nr:hypothetical protein [Tanacetum cinerariifolium]
MNQRRKAIAKMKAKAKRDKPLTPAQQKEYMRAFVKNQRTAIRRAVDLATAKDHHQHLKRSGETLESSESKKLKSSYSTEQSAELLETTSVSAGATLAAGDPISDVPSVSAVSSIFAVPFISATSSILAETPIAAGVSTTTGVSESASVPIIDLLDSPPKATSLPLDLAIAKHAVPLRKPSRKKSMARRRTLPRPSQSESAALPFDEDNHEAEFKKNKTAKDLWDALAWHMFGSEYGEQDRKATFLALTISARVFNCSAFKLEEIVMAMMTCLKSSGVHYQCFTKLDNKQVTIQFKGGLLGIVIPAARAFYFCYQVFISASVLFLLLEYSVLAVSSSLLLLASITAVKQIVVKKLGEMNRYLSGISTKRRSEAREHYKLKQSAITLEDQMRGLMLEDKEEKERLKKKLSVSQQEKKQIEQAFHHVIDWIRKQFGVEIPPCMVATLGLNVAIGKSWGDMKKMMLEEFCPDEEVQRMEDELRCLKLRDKNIAAYTQRFHELVLLCPEAVPTEKKKVEAYIKAHTLMEQKIQAKAERVSEGNKRKWENSQGGNKNNNPRGNYQGNTRHQQYNNQRQGNARALTNALAEQVEYKGYKPFCNNGHLFKIDIMPIELGTFDVIIGMD